MVNKMEKFTQQDYEDLRTILTDINKHSETIIFNVSTDNTILKKLENWFNNNTYEFIEYIASEDNLVEDIFNKIYINIKNIKGGLFAQEAYISILSKLNDYYNKIENIAKNYGLNDKNREKLLKEEISKFYNYIAFSKNNIENSINEFEKKLKRYDVLSTNDFKDLIAHKQAAIESIDKEREKFLDTIDIYKSTIDDTRNTLLKNYGDLKVFHDKFKNKIYKDLNDIQNSVNREQLAAYFLNERKKLKGDIDVPIIICTILVEIFIVFIFDIYTEFWHFLTFFKMIVFLVGIFIAIIPFLKSVYYKYFDTERKNNVKPFDEIKAILTPYWCWLGLTFLGMFFIFTMADKFYTEDIIELLQAKPFLVLSNLPIFMILVWFTWFCSKQFSYTKQICDEYEYKYALSKSYLSYRDEAKELAARGNNDAILVALLDSVIKNIATSPVKSVKPDCHTPFTEVFGSLKEAVSTVKNGNDSINK